MREIKFNFIYGIDSETSTYFNKSFSFGEIENGSHRDEICDNPLLIQFSILVKRQYTGLKDKNGKEIYEGDIVRAGKLVGAIEWRNSDSQYVVVNDEQRGGLNYYWMKENSEIIGNIYENPELLK